MIDNTASILQSLTDLLLKKQYTIATAESCTGGLIAAQLTSLPGSSAWFECGYVTYSNESKQHMLNIPEFLITRHGAVSEEVAQAMAESARRNSETDTALAVTGIAGPTGGTPSKPVGTVCFAFTQKTHPTLTKTVLFSASNRETIRQDATREALLTMIDYLQGEGE